jgi:hypothetical protein
VYWVSNSLQESVTTPKLIGMAASLSRLGGGH